MSYLHCAAVPSAARPLSCQNPVCSSNRAKRGHVPALLRTCVRTTGICSLTGTLAGLATGVKYQFRPVDGSGILAMSAMRTWRPGRATVVEARWSELGRTHLAGPVPAGTAWPPQDTERRSGEAPMARRDSSPDFIEALARGVDVIRAFQPRQPVMSLSAVAAAAGLARPTARRIVPTLEQMGYVRAVAGGFELTPRVLELGM